MEQEKIKPKIVHLSTVHVANDVRIMHKECQTLVESGYNVTLVARAEIDFQRNGISVKGLRTYNSKILRMSVGQLAAIFTLLKIQFDVLHFHDPELIPAGLIFKLFGKKVVFDVHENLECLVEEKKWLRFKPVISFMFRHAVRVAAKYFSLVVAETSYQNFYLSLGSNPTVILNYPKLDALAHFKMPRVMDFPRLFYIGGVTAERGIINILSAIKLMIADGERVEFHCVGPISKNLLEDPEFMSLRHDLSGHAYFYGPKDPAEGYGISKKCNIGMCVLNPLKNYVESCPTKLFEYISVGLPFITSDFPLYRKICEESGLGMPITPGDPALLRHAIVSLMKADRYAMAAVSSKNQYSWETEKEKLLSLYAGLGT